MATLVKIGDTVINFDQVTQMYFKPGSVRIYFAVSAGKSDERHLDVVELFGRDAAALRTYVTANVDDVLELVPPGAEELPAEPAAA